MRTISDGGLGKRPDPGVGSGPCRRTDAGNQVHPRVVRPPLYRRETGNSVRLRPAPGSCPENGTGIAGSPEKRWHSSPLPLDSLSCGHRPQRGSGHVYAGGLHGAAAQGESLHRSGRNPSSCGEVRNPGRQRARLRNPEHGPKRIPRSAQTCGGIGCDHLRSRRMQHPLRKCADRSGDRSGLDSSGFRQRHDGKGIRRRNRSRNAQLERSADVTLPASGIDRKTRCHNSDHGTPPSSGGGA